MRRTFICIRSFLAGAVAVDIVVFSRAGVLEDLLVRGNSVRRRSSTTVVSGFLLVSRGVVGGGKTRHSLSSQHIGWLRSSDLISVAN